jgi:hypothetical protein
LPKSRRRKNVWYIISHSGEEAKKGAKAEKFEAKKDRYIVLGEIVLTRLESCCGSRSRVKES